MHGLRGHQRKLLYISAALIVLAAAITIVAMRSAVAQDAANVGTIGFLGTAAIAARWLAILAIAGYAFSRGTLTAWIFAGMFVGAEIGHDLPRSADALLVLSKIFLLLIKSIIAPLILSTLVVGIAGHADLKQVGRMGLKALIYFEVVTSLALLIGLGAINLTKAGVGVHMPAEAATTSPVIDVKKQPASEIILHAFPENIAKSVAEGQVLQVVVFAVIFGIALALVTPERRAPMLAWMESLSETMFKFTNIVMLMAPVGVAGAMAYTVGKMGLAVLLPLAKLLGTLYLALIAFLLLVLLPVALLVGVPIRRFIAAVAEPASIAFATASSEAALPRALEKMEALGVPRQIVAFVLPTGYSFNLDGSTLYLALASVFVAQAAGVPLTLTQEAVMVFTLMLTSKGVAGVPRAMLVILLGTLSSFNLPAWPVFLILGIDQLMDMARTAVNVTGNCLATVVIARWENEFPVAPASPAVLEGIQP